MKVILSMISAAILALTLTACGDRAEQKVEDKAENAMDASKEKLNNAADTAQQKLQAGTDEAQQAGEDAKNNMMGQPNEGTAPESNTNTGN